MEALMNQMRRAAHEAMGTRTTTRHGLVSSYDPSTHAVKVELQPEGTLTGWLPLKSGWVGNGWGMFAAPSIGDAVEVDFQEGDGGVGSVGHRFFNDVDRPLNVPAGEFWLVSKLGASVKLTNDGSATFTAGSGFIRIDADGNITSSGPWSHTGMFSANGIELTTHLHSGVSTGPGDTGAPIA